MSAIKLATPSSGSISLTPADTASNLTITVPAVSGTTVLQNASNNLLMNSGYGSDAVAYGCRAWVNFNGTGTVAIRASGNVSSITDNGVGTYTINFTTSLPDANASMVSSARDTGVAPALTSNTMNTASVCFVNTLSTAGAAYDVNQINVAVFR
jgi:hypothetical protein